MKKFKGCLCIIILLFAAFCLGGCVRTEYVTEIQLGDDLPVWLLNGAHTAAQLPDDAAEKGLIGIYKTDTERADVYVYSFPKKEGVSLEEFGQNLADERNIFCNMMNDRNVPAAVLNYHESIEDEHYIVQAYIYEAGADFIEVCTMFKTAPVPFGSGKLFIRMIREYAAQEQSDSPLSFDTVYLTENDRLPMLHIRQFSKNVFPVGTIEPDLLNNVSDGQIDALAADGWTPEEIISVYKGSYELLRGEVMSRNNLTLAFIGYIDDGIFKTRAFIDDGTEYVMLCAEAEAAKFQHVTNALIDAVGKTNL